MSASRIHIARAFIVALGLLLVSTSAFAQSTLTGVIKDTSGAVLPGVTVEAASAALIEKTRSVVSDDGGAYRLVDLRPGVYTLTFSLEGFSTVKREGIELPSDFTMTINSELKVGALEETLTVTGASPTVDVQSTTKSQVLNRETLDAIPTGRTIQGMGQLITGVSLNIPDVGGSRAMQQTYMSAHGMSASQTTVQVDGLMVNGLDGDGAVQSYFNSSMSQEMVYTTSGAAADVSGGGVRLNMVPKDGGNIFNGSAFVGFQDKSFQSDNLNDSLKARGLKSADGIDRLSNLEASLGGPIMKDRMWFFMSARTFHLDTLPADVFNADGSPGVDPQSILSAQARIVWQISTKSKLSVYNDRIGKNRGAAMTAGFDPATASVVWNSPIYMTGSAKYTSTLTNRLLLEGGFSTNYERYNFLYQDGIEKQRGTPEWYTQINKQDTSLITTYNAAVSTQLQSPDRLSLAASLSYVSGTHNIKVGIQDSWGNYRRTYQANGDIRAFFQNGVPFQVHALNTPWERRDQLHKDIGIYAQDAWTMNRLTLNYGARWEYFAHGTPDQSSPAGRFTAARHFDPIDMPTWKSIAPRFGAVYDIFGNQKTALKFSLGKYMQAGSTGFSETYNPLALTTAALSWTDLNSAGLNCATAGNSQAGCDKVPQGELGCTYLTPGCEINLAQLPAGFGVANLSKFDPDIKRMYNIETSVSVQHELMPRVSVSGGWFHRDYKNLRRRDNTSQSFADYTPFTMYSPIDGTAITYYNVSNAARTRITNVDLTAGSDRSLVVQRYGVQLQRQAAEGHHGVRRRHERADHRRAVRREVEPEPAPLLRPERQRHSVQDTVQDRRFGASEVRHHRELLVPEPSGLSVRHRRAEHRHRHRGGPERSARRIVTRQPEWPGHGVADHANDDVQRQQPVCGAGQVHRGSAGGSWNDGGLAVCSAHCAADRVRRPAQPARYQRREEHQDRPHDPSAEVRPVQRAECGAGLRGPRSELRHDRVPAAPVRARRARVPARPASAVLEAG